MVVVILVGAAVFSPAAAAPRRASFDPTEGEDVNDADLLPVTEGDLEDVTETVGLTELGGVFEGVIDGEGEAEFAGVTEIVGVTDELGV